MEQTETSPITNLVLTVSFAQITKGMERGSINSQHIPFRVPFYGLADLIGELDRICDYLDFPQAWENRRRLHNETLSKQESQRLIQEHWEKKQNEMHAELDADKKRFIGFSIQILCRQHVSLQGLLYFRKERIAFRSALELQNLILDAFELAAENKRTHSVRKPPIPLSV